MISHKSLVFGDISCEILIFFFRPFFFSKLLIRPYNFIITFYDLGFELTNTHDSNARVQSVCAVALNVRAFQRFSASTVD